MKLVFIRLFKVVIVLTIICIGTFYWSVTAQEKVFITALVSGITPVQKLAAKKLHDYPTQTTALALLAFVNFHAMSDQRLRGLKQALRELESLQDGDSLSKEVRAENEKEREKLRLAIAEEEKSFRQEYPRKNKLANEGLKSLCRLSGHSFGTHFEQRANGFSWGKVNKQKWAKVKNEMNTWALKTFGASLLQQIEGTK